MTKGEFMRELERYLTKIPENERKDALEYYIDYFAEAGITDDMLVPVSLGKPKEVAEQIIAEATGTEQTDSGNSETFTYGETESDRQRYGKDVEETVYYHANERQNTFQFDECKKGSTEQRGNTKFIMILILIVICSPVWFGLAAAFGGVVIGILASLAGLVIGFAGVAVGLVIAAFLTSSVSGAVLLIGLGMIFAALTLIMLLFLVMYCVQFIPWMIKGCVALCKIILGTKEQTA